MMKKDKINHMRKRTRLEEIILNLEGLDKSEEVESQIRLLKLEIVDLVNKVPNDDHKLYLSDIVEIEKPKFGSNNLILAPVGSGKSSLIENHLVKGQQGKILMLVSNRYLKEDVCPNDNKVREMRALAGESKMMFTSRNLNKYGEEDYEIHVMTYHEFGNLIEHNDNAIKDVVQIHCDEIHSLPEYKQMKQSEPLIHAIRYLFDKQKGKQIFYFTATNDNLVDLEKKRPGTMQNVTTFDYRNHPNIKKYMALSEYKINHIEQIRPHLKAKAASFDYFEHKGLAFSKTISGQKKIEKILIEEGYKPLLLWSDSNAEFPLSQQQLKDRKKLIETNEIPEPYNFLVINSAMREGWDLKDNKVKLAIMNTTSNTDFIQARGRIRKDIDILIYRTLDKDLQVTNIEVPGKYIDIFLTSELKKELCEELNITDSKGRIRKWNTIKMRLIEQGYEVIDTRERINGKQTRVSIISLP